MQSPFCVYFPFLDGEERAFLTTIVGEGGGQSLRKRESGGLGDRDPDSRDQTVGWPDPRPGVG